MLGHLLLLLLHLMVMWLLLLLSGRTYLRGLLLGFAPVLVPFEQVVRAELLTFVRGHHQCRLHGLLLVEVFDFAKHYGLN